MDLRSYSPASFLFRLCFLVHPDVNTQVIPQLPQVRATPLQCLPTKLYVDTQALSENKSFLPELLFVRYLTNSQVQAEGTLFS